MTNGRIAAHAGHKVLAVGTGLALAAAAPTAAQAAGWRLPDLNSHANGLKSVVKAEHCGKTKWGTWTFRSTINSDNEPGVAKITWKTKVTSDGAAHRTSSVSATGTAPDAFKTAVQQQFASARFRYVGGAAPKLETVQADGTRVGIRAFKPRRTKHC